MKKAKTIDQKKAQNRKIVAKTGGTRLVYGMQSWITAKTPCGNFVLHGGLGAMGVGTMWSQVRDHDRLTKEYLRAEIKPYLPDDVFYPVFLWNGQGCTCPQCAAAVAAVRLKNIRDVSQWLQKSIAKL